jgi:hypothetical protein
MKISMTNYYYPDKWLIIRVTDQKSKDVHYRVFGSWYGGYNGSDSWRLNSGIETMLVDQNNYSFVGSSGSTYVVHKDMYGTSSYGHGVLSGLIKKNAEDDIDLKILYAEDIDFEKIDYKGLLQ